MISPSSRNNLGAFPNAFPNACSPKRGSPAASGLNVARPFWYDSADDDVATNELRELLGRKIGSKLPDWVPAFDRTLSGASTSAPTPNDRTTPPPPCGPGALPPTPPPPCYSPPESPEGIGTFRANDLGGDESPIGLRAAAQQTKGPRASRKQHLQWEQTRKVFVGGIPQNIDEHGLCRLFGGPGRIEKAWLQMFHDDERQDTTKNHRGFGFVIFNDNQAVEQLLGCEFSRFLWFGDNLKLEVKRAVSRSGIPVPVNKPDEGQRTSGRRQQGYQLQNGRSSPAPAQAPAAAPSPNWQNGSPVASQSWQSHPWLYSDLPSVPPFPSVEDSFGGACPQNGREVREQPWGWAGEGWQSMDQRALGDSPNFPATSPSSQSPSNQFQASALLESSFPSNVLLGGFVGQRPRNDQELAVVLREALPECYED